MAKSFGNFLQTTHPLDKKNGTRLNLGTRLYHFLPNAAGHFVCEVLDERDFASILSISAGYRRYEPTDATLDTLAAADSGADGVDSGTLSPAALAKDQEHAQLAKTENVASKVAKPPKAATSPDLDASAPPEEGGEPPMVRVRQTRKPGTKTAEAAA